MKCPACGRENRAGAEYCAWCGEPMSPEPKLPAGVPPEGEPTVSSGPTVAPEGDSPAAVPAGLPASDQECRGRPKPDAVRAEGEPQGVQAVAAVASAAPDALESEGDESPPVKPATTQGNRLGQSKSLSPGDIVAERYEIVEQIGGIVVAGEASPEPTDSSESSDADEMAGARLGYNTYRARDLTRCAACGYDGNAPSDVFCLNCGASLDEPCYVIMVEHLRHAPGQYDAHFKEGQREYFVTVEPPSEAEEEGMPPVPLQLLCGHATDAGQQRDHNEDYLDARLYTRSNGDVLGLFIVADGLGGQDSGEVASRLATETVWSTLRETVWEPFLRDETLEPDALEAQLVAAVGVANQSVYATRMGRDSEMSTTLTLALVVDGVAYVANVGDSRTYLWNAGGLRRITKDHSLVQRLVDTGQIEPREVYSHPKRNLIYQSIGDRSDVQVDTFHHVLAPDDHLLLCSDGLWEMVRDEGIEEVLLAEPDPQRVSERLVHNANLAGGEDNISVIIIHAVDPRMRY